MDDASLEGFHAVPLRRVALGMAVVALAHPEEVGGEADRLARVGAGGVDGPEVRSLLDQLPRVIRCR